MRRILRHILTAALLIAGSMNSYGQTPDLENSSYELVPVVIEVHRLIAYGLGVQVMQLDSAEQQEFQHANLGEVMSLAPSVYVKSYGSNGIATPAFRGTGAGHTQVYWNGLPMNSGGLGLSDFSLTSSAMADRLRLVYGLPSLGLGSGGLGGAILVDNALDESTLYYRKKTFSTRLSQQIGSFGDSRSAFQMHFGDRAIQSGTHIAFNTARNDFPYTNTAVFGAPEQRQVNAGFRQFSALQNLRLEKFLRGKLNASVWVYDTDRDLPPTMLTPNLGEGQRDRGIRSRLGFKKDLRKDYQLKLDAAWFRESQVYENQAAELYAAAKSDRLIAQGGIFTEAVSAAKGIRFGGFDLRYLHDRVSTDGYPQGNTFDQLTASTHAVWHLRKWLAFSLRLREEVTTQGWSPLLGVLGGNLDWQKFTITMNAGRNYRMPSLNDLYWNPGGNPNLLPEQNWSAEVGLSRYFWKPGRNLVPYFSIAAHTNRVDNWILWVPTSFAWWAPENVSQVQVRGLEATFALKNRQEAFSKIKPDLRASYSLTSSQIRATVNPNDQSRGKQLIYTPLHAGQVMLRLRYRYWHLRYQQEFTGLRYTTRDNSESVPGFTVGNLHAGRTFKANDHTFTLQGGLNNIWNTPYQNIAWRAMPGRSFFVRLQWDFNREKEL